MGAFPSAAAQVKPFDPFEYRSKALQIQQQQQNVQSNDLDLQAKKRAAEDDKTIQQAVTQNPGKTLHDLLPTLSGHVTAARWVQLNELDSKMQESFQKKTEADLKIAEEQHKQYSGIYGAVMNMPDDQVQANWPQIAQSILAVPGNKLQVDPAKPMTKQEIQSQSPMLALNESYLQGEIAKRKAKADATVAENSAAEAPSKLAEAQANSAKAVKVNAGTDATGLTAENRVQQQQARATLSENTRHNKEMEGVAADKLTNKDRDFIDKTYVKPANDVEKSYQMFTDAYNNRNNAKTGAESMLALSTHLATTFGNVKGARVTKDMIEHHLGARGIGDSALVAVQKLTNGDVLSPDQWDAFKSLITQSRNLTWDTTKKEAARRNVDVTGSLPADVGGKGASNDPFAAFGGKTRQ